MPDLASLRPVLSGAAVALTFVGHVPYIRGMISGRVRPHLMTWGVWGVVCGVAWAAQVSDGAGVGAWVSASSAVICLGTAVAAWMSGSRKFPLFDWLAIAGCVVAGGLWALTDSPAVAVVLVTVIDVLAFAPTIRKGWMRPQDESQATFAWATLKTFLGLASLERFTVATACFPAYLVFANGGFVLMLAWRHRHPGTATTAVAG